MNTENTYGMHILVPNHLEDRDDIHVPFESFNPFVVTEPVTMLVQLTVDDVGALHMTPEGGTGKVVSISAALPEGEWERKGDPDYWQSSEIAQLEAGRYTCGGFLHNKQNESRFVYYAINFTPVAPLVVEVDSCPEPPRTVCCKQQCSCGGNGENGNRYKGAIINLCQLGEDTCAADAEIVPDIAASTGPGVVPNKLIRRSIWDWNATLEGDTLNIETADKCILPFNVDWQHGTASPTGTATNLPFQIQLLDDNFNPCTSGNPAYHMLCDDQNCRVVFSASTGKPERVISADDKVVTAEQYNAGVVTRFDASGNVVSCYSARDGLMLAAQQDDGSLNIAYFAPSAVTVNPDGTYTTTGDPFRTQNFRTVRDNDGRLVTTITRRQGTLPATIVTRMVEPGKVTIVQGSGNEAIQQTFQGYQAPNNMRYVIETVEKEDNSAPAINTITEEQLTSKGLCRLHHTDGRGSDVAQVTSYNYDENARLSRVNRPDGSYTRYEYDTLGRVVLEAEPWAGGGEKVTTTTYSTARFFDCRPASIEVSYHNNTVSTETRTYEDSAAVNRMTVNTTANGMTRTRVVETYGRTPAYAYAAGRVKSVTDVSGVQTIHEYAATAAHGAVHLHTVTTKAAGVLVAGQSTRREEYIAADDTVVFMQESVWDGSDWQLLSTTAAQYDEQHRRTRTTHGNGRFSTKTWMCCGVLSETDEDGVQTDYAYDSAQQLVETTRAAVYDGDTCITPETITEYVRDAAGRVTTTTTRAGALTTVTCTAYDAVGRVVAQTDALGRTTTTAYSADGLTTTQTTPSGATLVTTRNTDGSTAHVSGTGQRELKYAYDVSSGRMRTTVRLADDSILSQTLENGFGETVVETAPSTTGFIYTRSEYNNRGLLTRRYQDTGMGTTPTASTLYEYDSFGNVTRQVLALAAEPSPLNSPVEEFAYGVEEGTDGVYSITTRTRYNAAGTALTSTRKELISSLSSTLAEKSVAIDERGLTSTEWTEYGAGTVRDSYSAVPTSSITAHRVMVDGFTVSQSDHAGVASTQSRRFTETGLELTQTDGRGNATTTRTDIAGRTVSVTDAAGNTSTTAYNPYFDEPSVVTDACGKTACYKYDIRGRKVAEWGTAIQPACFGYDDANRMTSLTTFRAGTETITTDPSSRTDGDVTTWAYHATTGLEVSKTYADGKGTVKTYDAFNRLSTETDAREKVKTCSYEHARGLLLGITYSDSTTAESFVYNHLGQLTQVTDDAGVRSIGYNAYGEQETDSLLAEGVTHLVTETRDSFGRSTGYTYTKGDATQQTVTTAYGTDGRISGAGFIHGGQEKQFGYTYLQGSHLLQTLTKPNGMTLTQTYEQHRNLLTQMDYKRGNTLVARRSYQYDTLGRPTSRTLARQGATRNDVFTYNDRSELISDVVDGTGLNGWDYDNIGNRLVQQQGSACDTYTSNALNQYTAIEDETHDVFTPTYDDYGNQTRIKTSTGIWNVTYNAKNRPVLFTKDDNSVSVACTYDYMGRRATKVVTENGVVTTSHRFLYRGYLQIACCDRKRSTHPCLWLITWDPTQDVATRPLAIQKDSTWYTYGWDLTKNIWEAYTTTGYIGTAYTYTAYGQVTASGSITQPIQWSSEFHDDELVLVYYNYRYYNPIQGNWLQRDRIYTNLHNEYIYTNSPLFKYDVLGLMVGMPGCHLTSPTCGYSPETNDASRDACLLALALALALVATRGAIARIPHSTKMQLFAKNGSISVIEGRVSDAILFDGDTDISDDLSSFIIGGLFPYPSYLRKKEVKKAGKTLYDYIVNASRSMNLTCESLRRQAAENVVELGNRLKKDFIPIILDGNKRVEHFMFTWLSEHTTANSINTIKNSYKQIKSNGSDIIESTVNTITNAYNSTENFVTNVYTEAEEVIVDTYDATKKFVVESYYSLFRFLVIFLFSLTLSSCNLEEPEFPSFVKHIKLSANPLPLAEKTVAELNRHLKAVENGSETINDYPYIAAVILIGALENKNEDLLLEEIKQLVFFGCDIKTQDTSGAMALHYAALGGYEEISSYLQKNGLCLDAIDNLGLTPLMYALMGRADIKLEDWLCSGSRNLCQKDKMGNSLAHYAAQGGRVNMLLYLKENGVDILAHDNLGVSTVMAASYGGNLECIKFLQTEGSNMLHCASDGVNSIMYAAWGGSIDALKYCLSLGLELESVDLSGNSVVHHAAFGGHVSILRFLVQKNVDISRPNKDGLTAFVITAMAGNWTAMNYIYSNAHVSKAELLQAHQYALQYGHEECAKKIRLWLTEDTSK